MAWLHVNLQLVGTQNGMIAFDGIGNHANHRWHHQCHRLRHGRDAEVTPSHWLHLLLNLTSSDQQSVLAHQHPLQRTGALAGSVDEWTLQ
jgi:hypothetical protein